MIAFASSITKPDVYERCAGAGFERVAEPDSEILAYGAAGSIFRSYNLLLDKAAELKQLEAVVLAHQDAEIVDPQFCTKLRAALADPAVAIVGCAGASGQRSIAWWEGAVTWASFAHRYEELGGGEIPAMTFPGGDHPSFARPGEVDAIDGVLIAMSPWAARELRFDETFGGLLHGYDFDICAQARAAGHKVTTADLRLIHHHSMQLIDNIEDWMAAYVQVAEKWDAHDLNGTGLTRELRRAQAEAAAAKLLGGMADLVRQAQERQQVEHVANLERELEEMRSSASWRLTAPLRTVGRRRNRTR